MGIKIKEIFSPLLEIFKTMKWAYVIYNMSQFSKLRHNIALYRKFKIKKSIFSSISSQDFKDLNSHEKPWLDTSSLQLEQNQNTAFQSFDQNIQDALIDWSEKGFAILPAMFQEQADKVNLEIDQLLRENKIQFKYGNKLMFALEKSKAVHSIGKNENIIKILSFLLGKKVHLFQSINFIQGSQQKAHSDIMHMTTFPQGFLIAIWVALEDIKAEQGALFYYPGSHKWPYFLNDSFEHGGNSFFLGSNANEKYEEALQLKIKAESCEKEIFEAKKGDVLIWHANLVHGGLPVTLKDSTRKSVVFHYFAEDVICYHEITQRPALLKKY